MHWCRVYLGIEFLIFVTLGFVMKHKYMQNHENKCQLTRAINYILCHIVAYNGKTMPSLPYDYLLNDALAGGVGGGWWVGSRANKANEGWDRVGRSERQIGRWQPGQSCLFSTLLFTFLMITREW